MYINCKHGASDRQFHYMNASKTFFLVSPVDHVKKHKYLKINN